jgi:hypothetical protein
VLESAAYCLRCIGGCDCYLDNGLDAVFWLSGEYLPLAQAMAALLPTAMTAAVFTVPKTVSAATLSQALQGQEIPADGSQDLVLLHADENMVEFPRLLVEALALVDPDVPMQLAANDIRTLS